MLQHDQVHFILPEALLSTSSVRWTMFSTQAIYVTDFQDTQCNSLKELHLLGILRLDTWFWLLLEKNKMSYGLPFPLSLFEHL